MSGILERVEDSLKSFRPRSQKEFVALQIARRFNDTANLARYLLVAPKHPKRELLEAARLATQEHGDGHGASDRFFELLEKFRKEAA